MSDLISRQAAIDAIEHRLAEPAYQHTGEDWYAGMNCAESELYDLPSAQPEIETAKFIRWMECKKTVNYVSYTPHCKCSKCGTEFLFENIKYCYMCGSRMEVSEE